MADSPPTFADPVEHDGPENGLQAERPALENQKLRDEAAKLRAEAGKLSMEADMAPKRLALDSRSARLAIVTPLVATCGLLLTLGFQAYQFSISTARQDEATRETQRLQTQLREDARWDEGLKTFALGTQPATAAGMAFLETFLTSPRFGSPARRLIIANLASTVSAGQFRALFAAVFKPSWDELDDILDLDRALRQRYDSLYEVQSQGHITADQQTELGRVDDELSFLSRHIVDLLRKRPGTSNVVDLHSTTIWEVDLSGMDFSNINLNYTNVANLNLDDAVLCGTRGWSNVTWQHTAWWRVKRIERGLLKSLLARYPFNPSDPFYPVKTDQTDFNQRVAKLTATACESR